MSPPVGRQRPPSVVVGPTAAMVLQSLLDEEARRRVARWRVPLSAVDPEGNREVTDALAALEEAAQVWREWQHSAPLAGESLALVPAKAAAGLSVMELTTGQAAERIGCTPQRVGQLIGAGRLKARRAGRSWLVDSTSVETHMNGRNKT